MVMLVLWMIAAGVIVVVMRMVVAMIVVSVFMAITMLAAGSVVVRMIMAVVVSVGRPALGLRIGAAFGIERRLERDHAGAKTLDHRLDHGIAADAERLWQYFGR
jgi:hypothetical protein